MQASIANEQFSRSKIHPQKFAMWAGIAAMIMMFTGFTSAYIVRQAAGNWLEFPLPNIFFFSTLAIVLSSVTLHTSYYFFKKGNASLYRSLLSLTFILGLIFIIFQYQGWTQLEAMGIPLGINPSGDFIYLISGVHAAHVLGGIAVLVVALVQAFLLKYKVTPRRKLRFEITLTYWHFVDFLWVYLIIFFTLQR